MSNDPTRPPIRIRFRINIDTGETELIVDDTSPDRSEEYHDKVAHAIARFLDRNPQIQDAGAIRGQLDWERQDSADAREQKEKQEEKHGLTE